jgi:hypothetical protein
MKYEFPAKPASATWNYADFQVAEIFFANKNESESINVITKRLDTPTVDVTQLPHSQTSRQYITLGASGITSFKFVMAEAGGGLQFQRNGSTSPGPATITFEKIVLSKNPVYEITFTGGVNTAMTAIPKMEGIPKGRTTGITSDNLQLYHLPGNPANYFVGTEEYEFDKWTYDDAGVTKNWANTIVIEKSYTLIATWMPKYIPPDMTLELDPSKWAALLPEGESLLTAGTSEGGLVSVLATREFAGGKLTFTYDATSGKRAIIPISAAQREAIQRNQEGVTYKIVATSNPANVQFRVHVGDPTLGGGWNATNDAPNAGPIAGTYSDYFSFFLNKKGLVDDPTGSSVSYLMIQLREATAATLEITSIKIDLGDTAPAPDTTLNLNKESWGTPADNEPAYNSGQFANPVAWSDVSYADGKLTVTLNATSRNSVFIPVPRRLAAWAMKRTDGLTYTITLDAASGAAKARFCLAAPTAGGNWNATNMAWVNAADFEGTVVQYGLVNNGRTSEAPFGHFMIQCNDGDIAKVGDEDPVPPDPLVITSIKIELGDTTN